MNRTSRLFSNGDLGQVLNQQYNRIPKAVAAWNDERLLTTPEEDVAEILRGEFLVNVPVLHRDEIVSDGVGEGYITVRDFGRDQQIKQTLVTITVPFSGDREVFTLQPSTRRLTSPEAEVDTASLRVHWLGPLDADATKIRQGLDEALDTIDQWLAWCAADIATHNRLAEEMIIRQIQDRKQRLLANRNLDASLGYALRKRPDAATYVVPVTRKKIVVRMGAPGSTPFKPEPVLDAAQYEEALKVLMNQRNQLERSPGTVAKMGEEDIRNLLLVGLNSQFEGAAAGEVFNGQGKTDILIREKDRHIFIGECKIWKGPQTIPDTLGQLLKYLVWRDTKAALLLFIRSGTPSEVIAKALPKFREHPNYKRDGRNQSSDRHDFVFRANGDVAREISLAFLPFVLPKTD